MGKRFGVYSWCALLLVGQIVLIGVHRIFFYDYTKKKVHYVHVEPPTAIPHGGQADIDIALKLYHIKVPSGVGHPKFDPNLADRGLTIMSSFGYSSVRIGPAAFESWGLLGSTLAHEIEIHCHQRTLVIYLMDLFHLDGTGEAERQAYSHEVSNGRRFGLTEDDKATIADTMNYYYPYGDTSKVSHWLAKHFLLRDN